MVGSKNKHTKIVPLSKNTNFASVTQLSHLRKPYRKNPYCSLTETVHSLSGSCGAV